MRNATDLDVHLPVSALDSVDDYAELAQVAEAAGYDRVWLPETWGRNAVSVLSAIAERTDEIGIGTSVLNVYSRSPVLLGQTAASLQELSDGRFRLGVGPSGRAVIEGWHGTGFERPLRRTRETIEIVRQVLSGDPVEYRGEVFNLAGFRLRCDPPDEPVPIDATGMGPKAVELAGRFADGWHAIMFTPDGLRDRLEDLRCGADLGGREADDVRTMLSVTCSALPDGEHARDLVAGHGAFYLGAMGTYYREALVRQGYEDPANEVATAWANGDREGATDAFASELLDATAAAGTPDAARASLDRFASIDGLDAVAVGFPRGATVAEMTATLEAIAT